MSTKYLLQISCVDRILVSLIKQLEAFSCFILTATSIPPIADDILHKIKPHSASLHKFRVRLFQFIIDFFLLESVKAEVMQNIAEMLNWNYTIVLLVIELEGVLGICKNVTWKWVLHNLVKLNFRNIYSNCWWPSRHF